MNPHVEDKEALQDMFKDASESSNPDVTPEVDKLDRAGFMAAKLLMAENPRIIVY